MEEHRGEGGAIGLGGPLEHQRRRRDRAWTAGQLLGLLGDVEPDTDHHGGPLPLRCGPRSPRAGRRHRHLGEDAGALGALRPDEQVVRPLEGRPDAAPLTHRPHEGEAGEQRQPAPRRSRHVRRPEQHAEGETRPGRGLPVPPEPAAPGPLFLGQQRTPVRSAPPGGVHEVGVGRPRHPDHVDGGERAAVHQLVVEADRVERGSVESSAHRTSLRTTGRPPVGPAPGTGAPRPRPWRGSARRARLVTLGSGRAATRRRRSRSRSPAFSWFRPERHRTRNRKAPSRCRRPRGVVVRRPISARATPFAFRDNRTRQLPLSPTSE